MAVGVGRVQPIDRQGPTPGPAYVFALGFGLILLAAPWLGYELIARARCVDRCDRCADLVRPRSRLGGMIAPYSYDPLLGPSGVLAANAP